MHGYELYKFEGFYNFIKNKNEMSWFIIEDGKIFYECQCTWKEFSQKIKILKTKKSTFNISNLTWHCHEYRGTTMMNTLLEFSEKSMIKIYNL